MSIRKTLLIAFFGVSFASATLLATLAFVQARSAVRGEIENSLASQATGVATEIDKMMFERLQNAVTWSRLDIMQDLQIADVDKRLSQFLVDIQAGYGDVYLDLSGVDTHGRVVSSSRVAAVGTTVRSEPPWVETSLSGIRVTMESPHTDVTSGLVMRVPLPSRYASGNLGDLRLNLDWARISDVLDRAAGSDGRILAILDRDGRLIAASKDLRTAHLPVNTALADWRAAPGSSQVTTRAGPPFAQTDVIVGSASSHGYGHFSGFGWTTLVAQPVALALAPVHRMAMTFLAYLALVAGLTVLIANRVSQELARPIVALTRFAQSYMRNKVLQVPAAPGKGEVGELTGAFVQMVRDIDLSQQNLIRASKLAVVGEMSSIIAHEVRTPLGILRTSAQMLKREHGISAEGKELVGFIDTETERLNRLVSSMLDTARQREPHYSAVDMHGVVRHCVAMLGAQAQSRGIEISMSLDAAEPVIHSDEEQMTQVVLNLVMNALQILDRGGHVEIATRDDDSWLCVEIADDGPGLAPADRSKVFEAFFFRREGGIGLGLAIVQQIVSSHGGKIAASESKLGGALFSLRLPREQMESM